MGTRCRELERTARALLSADLGEVGCRRRAVAVRHERRLGLELELAAQEGDGLGEMVDRDRVDAGEGRLSHAVSRAQEALDSKPPCALGDGENASDPAQATVERELPDGGRTLERAPRQLLGGCEERERDRQVEARSLLAQLGRREVDRDAPVREAQLGGGDPTSDPLTRFLAGAVGKADDSEAGETVADVRLHVDPARLEADERMRDRACKHAPRLRAEW